MRSLSEVCEKMEGKLGRELEEKEIKFLQWMHGRYKEERSKELCKDNLM